MQDDIARLKLEIRRLRALVSAVGALLLLTVACAAAQAGTDGGLASAATVPTPVLDVQRINVREPDGTIRLVLSNDALAPGPIVDAESGKESDRKGGNSAGLVFYNSEGAENGALYIDDDSVGLSLDRWQQDQTVVLGYGEEENGYFSGLLLYERPDHPHKDTLDRVEALRGKPQDEANAKMREMQAAGEFGTYRAMVAKDESGAAVVELADRNQKPRIRLVVDAAGEPSMTFHDEDGGITYALPPKSSESPGGEAAR